MTEQVQVQFGVNTLGSNPSSLQITIRPEPQQGSSLSEGWLRDRMNDLSNITGSTVDAMINNSTDAKLPLYIRGVGKLGGSVGEIVGYHLNLSKEIAANGNVYRA